MSLFEVQFKSTMHERYSDVLTSLCELLFEVADIEVVEIFGGTAVTEDVEALASDNGFVIDTDADTAAKLVELIEAMLKRPISLEEVSS